MKVRRSLVLALALFLLTPLAAEAQQPVGKRLGVLSPFSASAVPDPFSVVLEELQTLGWKAGRNLIVERRYADGKNDRLPALAADLVATAPDVIITTTTPAVIALQQATSTVPIVFAAIADPVATGIVGRLGRPGSNITGISSFASELSAKRLELLRELAPNIKRVAVLGNPTSPATAAALREVQVAADNLGITLAIVEVSRSENLETALAQVAGLHPDALFVPNEPVLFPHRKRIAAFALAHKLPSVFGNLEHAEAGGLLAYAPSYGNIFRRSATYVDRILRGAKPGHLPIEQPNKIELVINVKAAKALGLTIPPSLLLRADQVIE